jgi:transcriptional regulator with GAF, ATPase, and Fis domain
VWQRGPLRQRPEDIVLLARHMVLNHVRGVPGLERFLREGPDGRLYPSLRGSFVDYLLGHPLPGNTRELESILVDAMNQSTGTVIRKPGEQAALPGSRAAAPASWSPEPPAESTPVSSGNAESGKGGEVPTREALLATLESAEWNLSRAGRMLGMHRNAVDRLIVKYGIQKGKRGG